MESLTHERPKIDDKNGFDGDKVRELQGYRAKCEKMLEDCESQFGLRQEFASRISGVRTTLNHETEWVDGLIGDGSWAQVQEKREAFCNEPTEENEKNRGFVHKCGCVGG